MYRLLFLSGKMKGRRVAVQQGTIIIGRDPSCHIDITDDDDISRKHAQLEQRDDGVYLINLSTTNPTTIDGKPIAHEHKLKQNDTFEIGRSQLQFQRLEIIPHIGRRRLGRVQFFTIIAVFCLLLIEFLIVFVLPTLRYNQVLIIPPAPPPEPEAKTNIVEVAQPIEVEPADTNDTLEAELERAAAMLNDMPKNPITPTTNLESATTAATEIEDLRAEVESLKKQFAEVTNEPPIIVTQEIMIVAVTNTDFLATNIVEAAVTTETAEVVQIDPLLEKAKIMLQEATTEIARHNLTQADEILERIQTMAPDFLPAYVERAKLLESLSMLQKAGEQWAAVMNRSIGTPLFEEASAERTRLARAELIAVEKTPKEVAVSSGRLPRKIRIMSVEREKFQSSKEFDEMRQLRIRLKPRVSERDIDHDEVEVRVTFYDRNVTNDQVTPTRATSQQILKVDEAWEKGAQKTVTATYVLPKDYRKREREEIGEKRTYEGYRVRLYYRDELQDEAVMPKSLPGAITSKTVTEP